MIPAKVFCDTSFLYASLDARDSDHEAAVLMTKWLTAHQIAALTSWEIVVETVTLLRYRLSYQGAEVFIKTVLPELNVIYISDVERAEALQLFLKLGKDKKLSLCDLISFVIVKEHFPKVPCIAFDDDFRRLGLIVLQSPP